MSVEETDSTPRTRNKTVSKEQKAAIAARSYKSMHATLKKYERLLREAKKEVEVSTDDAATQQIQTQDAEDEARKYKELYRGELAKVTRIEE